jgi:hypothetical protein
MENSVACSVCSDRFFPEKSSYGTEEYWSTVDINISLIYVLHFLINQLKLTFRVKGFVPLQFVMKKIPHVVKH